MTRTPHTPAPRSARWPVRSARTPAGSGLLQLFYAAAPPTTSVAPNVRNGRLRGRAAALRPHSLTRQSTGAGNPSCAGSSPAGVSLLLSTRDDSLHVKPSAVLVDARPLRATGEWRGVAVSSGLAALRLVRCRFDSDSPLFLLALPFSSLSGRVRWGLFYQERSSRMAKLIAGLASQKEVTHV